jgi:Tfp pilus assembly protein PilF
LALAEIENRRAALAKAELEQAIQLNDRDLSAFYQLGLVYNKRGEKDRAKQMLSALTNSVRRNATRRRSASS